MHLWDHVWSIQFLESSRGRILPRLREVSRRCLEHITYYKTEEDGFVWLNFQKTQGRILLQSLAAKWGLFRRWSHTALRDVCLRDKRQQSQLAAKDIQTGYKGRNLFTAGVIKHWHGCPKKFCNVYPWRFHDLGQTLSNLIQLGRWPCFGWEVVPSDIQGQLKRLNLTKEYTWTRREERII